MYAGCFSLKPGTECSLNTELGAIPGCGHKNLQLGDLER